MGRGEDQMSGPRCKKVMHWFTQYLKHSFE